MKKLLVVAIMIGAVSLFISGCSTIEDIKRSNAGLTYVDAPLDKVAGVMVKAAKDSEGYLITKKEETPDKVVFEGSGARIDCIKDSDTRTKVYVRCGLTGDRDKQEGVIKKVKELLNIKE